MKLCEEYIAYIKDNPEGYWFKRKLYGYGWTPAKPAGWIAVGVYVVFLLGVMWYAQSADIDSNNPARVIALIFGATILLIVISWRTGESLKWQWGRKKPNINE